MGRYWLLLNHAVKANGQHTATHQNCNLNERPAAMLENLLNCQDNDNDAGENPSIAKARRQKAILLAQSICYYQPTWNQTKLIEVGCMPGGVAHLVSIEANCMAVAAAAQQFGR